MTTSVSAAHVEIDSRPPGSIAAAILTIVLLVAIPIRMLDGIDPAIASPGRMLVAAQVATLGIATVRLTALVYRGEPRLFSAMCWIFIYVFMGLAPLVQIELGVSPSTTPNLDQSSVRTAAIATAISAVLLLVSEVTAPSRFVAERQSGRRLGGSPQSVIIFSVFALAVAVLYSERVGLGNLFVTRDKFRLITVGAFPNPSTRPLVVALGSFPIAVAFVAITQRIRAGQLRPTLAVLGLAILCGVGSILITNPVSSPRYYFGTVFLSILAGLGVWNGPKRFRFMTVAFLVAMIYVFPLADYFRRSNDGRNQQIGSARTALLSGDYDAFSQLANTFEYVHDRGITWGQQALGVAGFLVPRSLWPSKPLDTGILLGEYKQYDFTNLSAPIWAELYINGGWIVLLAGVFVGGRLISRFDAAAIRGATAGVTPVANFVLPFYSFILLRGSLLQASLIAAVIVGSAYILDRRRGEQDRS